MTTAHSTPNPRDRLIVALDQKARDDSERWRIWREEKSRREKDDRGRGVNSASLFASLNRHVPGDAILAARGGMFSHRWIDMCERLHPGAPVHCR